MWGQCEEEGSWPGDVGVREGKKDVGRVGTYLTRGPGLGACPPGKI